MLDVFIGIGIFIITIILLSAFHSSKPSTAGTEQLIDNIATDVFRTPLSEVIFTSDAVALLFENDVVSDDSFTVDELIVLLMENDGQDTAEQVLDEVLFWLPDTVGVEYIYTPIEGSSTILFEQSSLIDEETSVVGLSRNKLTFVADVAVDYDLVVSEVKAWQ